MIKKGIDLSYKVDPYGTEEIISSAANSCAPILTIDYGDEVQTDAEFTIRSTKGSLDTNISDFASINPIKGNAVAWNQLIQNGNFADGTTNWSALQGSVLLSVANNICTITKNMNVGWTAIMPSNIKICKGHKYLFSVKNKQAVANTIRVYCPNAFDLATADLPAGTWSTWNVICDASADGNELVLYVDRESNLQVGEEICQVSNIQLIDLTLLFGSGNEPSTVAAFEADYYKWFGKQLTYEPYSAGELRPVKMNGIKTTGVGNSWVSVNPIPVTTLTGKLNGQGSSVVVFPDGMKKAGSVYDEIVKVNGVWKAIKRVDCLELKDVSTWYKVSSSNKFYTDIPSRNPNDNLLCSSYTVYASNLANVPDMGISKYVVDDTTIVIHDERYSNTADFGSAVSSVKVYYELATHEEYILDAFDVQKLMLGANEVQKVYLGSDLIFEETN